MLSGKTCTAAFLLGAVWLLHTPAYADVVSATGAVELVRPPADLRLDATVSLESIAVFDEQQDVAVPFGIDAVTDFATGDWVFVPAGLVVDSHLLHLDLPGADRMASLNGTVTFRDPIVGLIVTAEELNATDDPLGLSGYGTTYDVGPNRGLDLGQDTARVATDDPRVLEVEFRVDSALDQIRVLTSPDFVGADVAPDTGPAPDTGLPDTSVIDTGSAGSDVGNGLEFRGAGGCDCRAASNPNTGASIPLLGAVFLLLVLSRRRR
jgi:MYXO-CTERM domain-containing protein